MRFEYLTLLITGFPGGKNKGGHTTDELLNIYGEQGWEVVSVIPFSGVGNGSIGSASGMAILKRAKP